MHTSAGGQLSLLFEDLFKKMNSELLMEAKKTLSKANRSASFDAAANLRSDIITNAMETALSTGCWNIKRFRMDRKGATQVRQRFFWLRRDQSLVLMPGEASYCTARRSGTAADLHHQTQSTYTC
jgi:DNA-directed RNA polymerase beta subunit